MVLRLHVGPPQDAHPPWLFSPHGQDPPPGGVGPGATQLPLTQEYPAGQPAPTPIPHSAPPPEQVPLSFIPPQGLGGFKQVCPPQSALEQHS